MLKDHIFFSLHVDSTRCEKSEEWQMLGCVNEMRRESVS